MIISTSDGRKAYVLRWPKGLRPMIISTSDGRKAYGFRMAARLTTFSDGRKPYDSVAQQPRGRDSWSRHSSDTWSVVVDVFVDVVVCSTILRKGVVSGRGPSQVAKKLVESYRELMSSVIPEIFSR